MGTGDFSLTVNDEGSRQRRYTAVEVGHFIGTDDDAVVHLLGFDIGFHGLPAILIHGDAEYGEAAILEALFKIDEPGDFDFAGAAPGGPEVQEHHFSFIVGKLHRTSMGILEGDGGLGIAVFLGFDGRTYGPLAAATGQKDTKRRKGGGRYETAPAGEVHQGTPYHQRLYRQRTAGYSQQPEFTAGAMALGESMLSVGWAPDPSSRVAETLTDIMPPAQSTPLNVGRIHCQLTPFGGPT